MRRRHLLSGLGTAAAAGGLAGCVGGGDCGPGEDEFADVNARVGDGELPGDRSAIDVNFEAEVVRVTDLERLIVDDTTAKAELYTAGGYEFADTVNAGECYTGDGSAIAKDNDDEDRLVVQVSSMTEKTMW